MFAISLWLFGVGFYLVVLVVCFMIGCLIWLYWFVVFMLAVDLHFADCFNVWSCFGSCFWVSLCCLDGVCMCSR